MNTDYVPTGIVLRLIDKQRERAEAAETRCASLKGTVQAFIEDVDDALSDAPSGHDSYVRIGARFLERHDKPMRAALGGLVGLHEQEQG